MSTDKYAPSQIGAKLKALRISKGLTLEEVGKAIGRSPSAVSGYERARRFPDPDTLINLLAFYEVKNIGQFWGFADSSPELSYTERELLAGFQVLNDNQKKVILYLVKHLK